MSAVGDECEKLAAWLRLIYCMLCGSLRWLGADNLSKSVRSEKRVEEGRKERLQKAGDRTLEETQPKPEKIQLEGSQRTAFSFLRKLPNLHEFQHLHGHVSSHVTAVGTSKKALKCLAWKSNERLAFLPTPSPQGSQQGSNYASGY